MEHNTTKLIELFERKMKELSIYDVEKISSMTESIKKQERLHSEVSKMLAMRTVLQDYILEDPLNFLRYVDGCENVFPFQEKLFNFIRTGVIPDEWKDIPDSFFRHSGGNGFDNDICVLIPRSLRKTTLFSKLHVWFYLKKMETRTIFSHNDLELCGKNLILVKNVIMNEDLANVFPDRLKTSRIEYNQSGGRITQWYLLLTDKNEYPGAFTKAKEGNFEATSLKQDLASQHYHRAYLDDIVIANTSKTPEATAKVAEYVDALGPLAVNLNEGIRCIFTGTAWFEGSYYEYLKTREAPITFVQLPAAWGVIDEHEFIYENYLCEELLGPVGLKMNFERTKYKPFFWSQFFMRCIPFGGDNKAMTERTDFVIPESEFPDEELCYNALCVDPISREVDTRRRNKSKGVCIQISVMNGSAYVRTGFVFNSVPDVSGLVTRIVDYVEAHNIDALIVEKIHAQRWLAQLLRQEIANRKIPCVIIMHGHGVSKYDHIYIESGLQAMFDAFQIYVEESSKDLIAQIKGDAVFADELDALSFFPSEVPAWQHLKAPSRKKMKFNKSGKPIFKGTRYNACDR